MLKFLTTIFAVLISLVLVIPVLAVSATQSPGLRRPMMATPNGSLRTNSPIRPTTPAGELIRGQLKDKLKGFAHFRGTITSVNSESLVVDGKTINTSAQTKFLRKFGGVSALAEFSVGDEVSVWGKWTDDSHSTVDAKIIRNLSIQIFRGTFIGTIKSISSAGFALETINRKTQTVTVGANTKYFDRRQEPIVFSQLALNHRVRVKGLWNNKLNTLTDVRQVKDFSIPAKNTPVATPSAIPTP